MILYIIRHGETEWNKMGKMQGKTDISLSEDGRKLAQKTADGLKNIKFDYIFSSPLERAYETACIIKGDRDIEIVKDWFWTIRRNCSRRTKRKHCTFL